MGGGVREMAVRLSEYMGPAFVSDPPGIGRYVRQFYVHSDEPLIEEEAKTANHVPKVGDHYLERPEVVCEDVEAIRLDEDGRVWGITAAYCWDFNAPRDR